MVFSPRNRVELKFLPMEYWLVEVLGLFLVVVGSTPPPHPGCQPPPGELPFFLYGIHMGVSKK